VIGEEIEQLQRKGHALDEIAILVRASFQMREFEERFITLGLPYRVIGGPRFYERAEIRDALAYFRCVAQPADDLAFERIFNLPKRGLGDATLQLLHDHARSARIPLMQAARTMVETEELKPKQRQTLRSLLTDFSRWSELIESKPQGELAEIILEESGYTDLWRKEKTADAAGRLENLKELIRSMEEFPDLGSFLEHISLVMDAANMDSGARVSIMTLHAAKGLEFETVFLPGFEEGLFPHQRSLDDQGRAGLEEERRLAYVGLTRAKRRAKIYFATNRRIHGLGRQRFPRGFWMNCPRNMSKSSRRRRARPMAATRNRALPIWIAMAHPIRRRAGNARNGAARRQGRVRAGIFKTAGRGGDRCNRGRTRREFERGFGLCERRADISHEIRRRNGGGSGWQQAHHRF